MCRALLHPEDAAVRRRLAPHARRPLWQQQAAGEGVLDQECDSLRTERCAAGFVGSLLVEVGRSLAGPSVVDPGACRRGACRRR
jgi:hypothetical protein